MKCSYCEETAIGELVSQEGRIPVCAGCFTRLGLYGSPRKSPTVLMWCGTAIVIVGAAAIAILMHVF